MNMKTSPDDVSNQEILEAITTFASSVDDRFNKVDAKFTSIDQRFDRLESRVDDLAREQGRMRAVMVTKDYLDDKLANLHSDVIQQTRREIEKALN